MITDYTMNVIADTQVGRSDRVIVVGSHLDSVPAGPGINDNGYSLTVVLHNRVPNNIPQFGFLAQY